MSGAKDLLATASAAAMPSDPGGGGLAGEPAGGIQALRHLRGYRGLAAP